MKNNWEISFLGWRNIMGVYCIIENNIGNNIIHYVGSSKNIDKRINNQKHPYRILFNKGINCFVKFKRFNNVDDMLNLERNLIRKIKPNYNTQNK